MKKTYKTNITCSGCIEKATPILDACAGEKHWDVNLREKAKTLTIDLENINAEELKSALKEIGFNIEEIKS
ncbi:MAG: hypothetical protein M3Q95_11800 [Bacteroidota bacterium]|nr:hypothetical protein [Bacteroidota bacterium]